MRPAGSSASTPRADARRVTTLRLARLGPIVVAAAVLGAATSSVPPSLREALPLDARFGLLLPAPRALVLSPGLAAVAGELRSTGQELATIDRDAVRLRVDIQSVRRKLEEAQRVLEHQLEAKTTATQDAAGQASAPQPSASAAPTDGTATSHPSSTADSVDRTIKGRERLSNSIRELQARIASLHRDLNEASRQLESVRARMEGQSRSLGRELGELRAERSRSGGRDLESAVQIGAGQHLLAQLTAVRHQVDQRRAELAGLRGELGSQERGSADQLASDSFAEAAGIGDSPFLICPVDPPRSYSDDFGAPRWAGGFHTHQGNDIFAPLGTPIRAPFDGNAVDAANGLGGLAVKVFGAGGWVYNAHLSAYGTLGQVQAGEIIGYVGNTGDAVGTSPHDHFEWHPGGGAAVSPFPFLREVC